MRRRPAGGTDAEALARLINAAFIVERPMFDGDRTSPEGVRAFLERGQFLIAEDAAGLAGCVYVELRGDRGQLGYAETHTGDIPAEARVPSHFIYISKRLA